MSYPSEAERAAWAAGFAHGQAAAEPASGDLTGPVAVWLVSMPRCATCRHWWRPYPEAPDDFGSCGMVEDDRGRCRGLPWIGGNPEEAGPLFTPPDFGCTAHEPIEVTT